MTVTTYAQTCIPKQTRDFSIYRITNDARDSHGFLRFDNSGDIERPGLLVKAERNEKISCEVYNRKFEDFLRSAIPSAIDGGILPEYHQSHDMLSRLFTEKDADGWKVTAIDFSYGTRYSVEFYLKNPLQQAARENAISKWKQENPNAEFGEKELGQLCLPTASIRLTWDFSKERDARNPPDAFFLLITAPKKSGNYPAHKWVEFYVFLGLPRITEITRKHRKFIEFYDPPQRENEDQELPICPTHVTEIHF